MKVIRTKNFPPGRFMCINLFGVLFTKEELSDVDINHELIHTAQMKELLYILFYVWYGIEWIINFIVYGNAYTAYRNLSFEQEAYANQGDLEYLSYRNHYEMWIIK